MASRRVLRGRNFGSYIASLNQDVSLLSTRPSGTSIAGNVVGSSELSSNISLENNTLQSSNYVPGYYGWKIDSSGLAEFGNVYVRGDINARTGTIGYWHISTPTVERTIGNRQLFGTFLESSDVGYSDNGKTSGSYVSLFKSYDEPAVSITHKYRRNNIATITAPEHGFENADYISINVDGDVSFSTGESSVQIFSVTGDTFSYVNTGSDFLNADSTGAELDTSASGTAQLYIKDVSGLYLQDYGKALFDYGYFSNEGIAYVSAETPNLVYNPSFEYEDGGTYQFSDSSWIAGTSAIDSYTYQVTNRYNGDSYHGAKITWDGTALNTYVHAKVNESEFKRLDFYKNNRELFLNFDMFYIQENFNRVTIPYNNSFYTTSSSIITIVCPGHGLAVDDLVYLLFTTSASGYSNYTSSYRVHTVLSVSGDEFTIENKLGTTTSNPIVLGSMPSVTGGDSPSIFKYIQPVLDLNDIKISFVTGYDVDDNPILDSTTLLYDVVTDVTAANWNDYRYWSHSLAEWENWFLSSGEAPAYRAISSMGLTALDLLDGDGSTKQVLNIKLSSSKIEAKYRSLANNEYRLSGEFYLSFPEWIWEGTESDASTAPTKRDVKAVSSAGASYVLDNVSISPNKKFFFGDSGSSSFYYKLTDADPVKTNKVSYEAPRQWLDIDLDYQTAQLKYMDSIEFKSSDFLRQLYINPGINTIKNYRTVFAGTQERLLIGESSVLNISSGQYRYLDEGNVNYRTVEALSSQETGTSSAIYQIKAISSAAGNMNSVDNNAGGIFRVAVDTNDLGYIEGYADYINMRSFQQTTFSVAGNTGSVNFDLSPNYVSLYSSLFQVQFNMSSSFSGFADNIPGGYSATRLLGVDGDFKVVSPAIASNLLASNYTAVYISNTGYNAMGYISSSILTKKNVEPLSLSINSILAAEPVQFNYKSEEDGSPKHAGFIAEQLVESGLGGYVSFDEDGNPKTVNYEMFVSALQSVVRHQASQLADLTSRLEALEGK